MAKKPSLGRQKIKIARIEKPNHRQVTFSKRRSGLFKKACELCTLCGVEIVIVVFSPASKVFSFGHPDVDALVDRFLLSRGLNNHMMVSSFDGAVNTSVRDLNAQLTHVSGLLDAEKEHKEALDRAAGGANWWEAPIDKLGRGELEQLAASLGELKRSVFLQAKAVNEAVAAGINPFQGKHSDQELGAVSYENKGFGNLVAHHHGFGGF